MYLDHDGISRLYYLYNIEMVLTNFIKSIGNLFGGTEEPGQREGLALNRLATIKGGPVPSYDKPLDTLNTDEYNTMMKLNKELGVAQTAAGSHWKQYFAVVKEISKEAQDCRKKCSSSYNTGSAQSPDEQACLAGCQLGLSRDFSHGPQATCTDENVSACTTCDSCWAKGPGYWCQETGKCSTYGNPCTGGCNQGGLQSSPGPHGEAAFENTSIGSCSALSTMGPQYCSTWKQTEGTSKFGPPVQSNNEIANAIATAMEKDCNTGVPSEAPGACLCADGSTKGLMDAGHPIVSCNEVCAPTSDSSWTYTAPAPPCLTAAECEISISGDCRAYPDRANKTFPDQDYGGPIPTTSQACTERLGSWKGSCANDNITMTYKAAQQNPNLIPCKDTGWCYDGTTDETVTTFAMPGDPWPPNRAIQGRNYYFRQSGRSNECEPANTTSVPFCPNPRYSEFMSTGCSSANTLESCQLSVNTGWTADSNLCKTLNPNYVPTPCFIDPIIRWDADLSGNNNWGTGVVITSFNSVPGLHIYKTDVPKIRASPSLYFYTVAPPPGSLNEHFFADPISSTSRDSNGTLYIRTQLNSGVADASGNVGGPIRIPAEHATCFDNASFIYYGPHPGTPLDYIHCQSYSGGASEHTPMVCLDARDGSCAAAETRRDPPPYASCPGASAAGGWSQQLISNPKMPQVTTCSRAQDVAAAALEEEEAYILLGRTPPPGSACTTGDICPIGMVGAVAHTPTGVQGQNYICCNGNWMAAEDATEACPREPFSTMGRIGQLKKNSERKKRRSAADLSRARLAIKASTEPDPKLRLQARIRAARKGLLPRGSQSSRQEGYQNMVAQYVSPLPMATCTEEEVTGCWTCTDCWAKGPGYWCGDTGQCSRPGEPCDGDCGDGQFYQIQGGWGAVKTATNYNTSYDQQTGSQPVLAFTGLSPGDKVRLSMSIGEGYAADDLYWDVTDTPQTYGAGNVPDPDLILSNESFTATYTVRPGGTGIFLYMIHGGDAEWQAQAQQLSATPLQSEFNFSLNHYAYGDDAIPYRTNITMDEAMQLCVLTPNCAAITFNSANPNTYWFKTSAETDQNYGWQTLIFTGEHEAPISPSDLGKPPVGLSPVPTGHDLVTSCVGAWDYPKLSLGAATAGKAYSATSTQEMNLAKEIQNNLFSAYKNINAIGTLNPKLEDQLTDDLQTYRNIYAKLDGTRKKEELMSLMMEDEQMNAETSRYSYYLWLVLAISAIMLAVHHRRK